MSPAFRRFAWFLVATWVSIFAGAPDWAALLGGAVVAFMAVPARVRN